MKGTITKYRKKDGRVSWGYYYKAEGRQHTKSGFSTKFDAATALDQALGNYQDAGGVARTGDTRTLAEYLRTGWIAMPRSAASPKPWRDTASTRII